MGEQAISRPCYDVADMEPEFLAMGLTGIGTGFLFGYVIQRGGFCLTRGLSNLFIMGDATIARAYVLAILVAAPGIHALSSLGFLEIPVRPFHWVSNLAGGFIFGVGMILSGGCAGSSWYRVGEGALGAWTVVLGFAMGATATSVGVLVPLRRVLQTQEILIHDQPPTLATLVGVSPWVVIVVLGLAAVFWLWRSPQAPESGKWSWPVTGFVVGLLIALGWYTSSFGETPTGITFAINTSHIFTYPLIRFPNRVNWSMLLLIGVVVGAFFAAWRNGEFAWKLPKGFTIVQLLVGGLIMGIGAILAEGCNITQGLTNSATLALGSLVAFGAMILGAWVTVRLMFLRGS